MKKSRLLLLNTTAVVVFVLSFLGSVNGFFPSLDFHLKWPNESTSDDQEIPINRMLSGKELVLIYFGSSTCSASQRVELQTGIKEIKHLMNEKARILGHSFSTIGVSLDWSIEDGIKHLIKFGRFDEIVVGRGMYNSASFKYIWQDIPGRAATPQILVIERTNDLLPLDNTIKNEQLVVRKIGVSEIVNWRMQDLPLPELSPLSERTTIGEVIITPQ